MEVDIYNPVVTQRDVSLPLYIMTIGTTPVEKRIYRPDGIAAHQVLYTEEGSGTVKIWGKTQEAAKGSILYIPPNIEHNYYMNEGGWRTSWITFGGSVSDKIIPFETGVWTAPAEFDFMKRFQEIKKYANNDKWTNKRSVLLYSLLLECRDWLGEGNANFALIRERLKNGIAFIESNFCEDIELSQISEICKVSREHFCRMFKEYMGMSPFDYIKKLRIQKAKELLMTKRELRILEIGKTVGFQSSSYFSKVFKSETGLTPEKYRKSAMGGRI